MTEHSQLPPSRGLVELPSEILHMICANLCVHCTQSDTEDLYSTGIEGQQSLLALSGTCKTLRGIAQPLAYHFLAGIPKWRYFPSFIRSMVNERRDLAAQVRWFHQGFYDYMEYAPEWLPKSVTDVAEHLGLRGENDIDFATALADDFSLGRFCLEMLIAMLPNLERLDVLVQEDGNEEGSHYYYTAERIRKLGVEAASMPQLKHLTFETEDSWGFASTLGAVPLLLSLAPNLERLTFDRCTGAEWKEGTAWGEGGQNDVKTVFPHGAGSSIRAVELTNCALESGWTSRSFLNEIIAHSPRLESFRYMSQAAYIGENISVHVTTEEFLNCLRPVCSSLTLLDIDMTHHSLRSGSNELASKKTMQLFEKLETLRLDDTSFCHHRHNNELPATCLTELLPANLETLCLRLYEGTGAWGDLERLANEISKFPKLRHVTISCICRMHGGVKWDDFFPVVQEKQVILRDLFADKNVSVEVLDASGDSL